MAQSGEAVLIEPREPTPHRVRVHIKAEGDDVQCLAIGPGQNETGSACRSGRTMLCQALEIGALGSREYKSELWKQGCAQLFRRVRDS